MKELTIKCFPAINTSGIERSTRILNGGAGLDLWLQIERGEADGFSEHLSTHWFVYTRADGHQKHYITNDESQVRLFNECVERSDQWSYQSFRL